MANTNLNSTDTTTDDSKMFLTSIKGVRAPKWKK